MVETMEKTWTGTDNWYNSKVQFTYYPECQVAILNIECHIYPFPDGWMVMEKDKFCKGFKEEPKTLIFGDTTITLKEDGTLVTSGDELF